MKSLRSLLKETGLLFIATMGANVGNGLFQLVMGGMLTANQFGILTSLLSVFLVFSVPVAAIQTVTTKYVANFKATDDYSKIKQLLLSSTKHLLVLGLLLAILITAASGYISAFLKINSSVPVLIIAAALLFSLILPVGRGVLQGMQKFNLLGLNLLTATLLRLLTAITLVLLGFGASGALLGSAMGPLAALAIIIFPLARLLKPYKQQVKVDLVEIYNYFGPTLATIFFYYLAIGSDIVIVKHFFSPRVAGYYAGAVTMGKVTLFLPAAISMVMFSKSAEQHTLEQDTLSNLKRYLFWAGVLSGAVALLYFIIPKQIMLVIGFGKYTPVASVVGILGLAMAFFALNNILFLYQLSVHRLKFIWLLAFLALSQIVALWLFHSSLMLVAVVVMIYGCLMFATNFAIVFQREKIIALQKKLFMFIVR
jgi:O-antigen/teichoic acid export membrane protein